MLRINGFVVYDNFNEALIREIQPLLNVKLSEEKSNIQPELEVEVSDEQRKGEGLDSTTLFYPAFYTLEVRNREKF